MGKGKNVLRSLDRDLHGMRTSLASQAESLSLSSRYLADVRQEQAQAMRELARMRLDEIQESAIAGEVDASQKHVQQLLAKHHELLRQARDATQACVEAIGKLESLRESQDESADSANAELDAAVAATRKRLERDTAYMKQADGVREAQVVADGAAQKSELALQDRIRKGAPYEADPMFMYLWERKYGTDAYAALPLFRTLDGWVAGLCNYDGARRNYGVLIDIPLRLEKHSERVAARADQAEANLEQVELAAFSADGHDAVRAAAEDACARLLQLDEQLDAAEARHLDSVQVHTQLANGTDPTYRQALEAVLQTLRRKDLVHLRAEVEQTPLPEDDLVVGKLLELEQEETVLQERVRQENESVHGSKKLLGDLEWIRREFKRARFDTSDSEFQGSDFLTGLISQLSRRTISRDTFWTSLARRHRRRDPLGSFGGFGGFGDVSASAWALGSMATRSLAGRSRRRRSRSSRASSGGSLRSGGGGGFRTGGSF
ncbi:MAG: hypothetical protein ACI8QZ_000692 [Chlamydiales bacterium]|jgi:hypothetical protein